MCWCILERYNLLPCAHRALIPIFIYLFFLARISLKILIKRKSLYSSSSFFILQRLINSENIFSSDFQKSNMELENGMDIDLSLNRPHFDTYDQEEDEENETENSSKQIRYVAARIRT